MNQAVPDKVQLLTYNQALERGREISDGLGIKVSKAHLTYLLKKKGEHGGMKYFPSVKLRSNPLPNGKFQWAIADVDFERYLVRALRIDPPKISEGLPGVSMERTAEEIEWPTLTEGEG